MVSIPNILVSNDQMTGKLMSNKLERMSKEAAVT
jgi:hypothetical protein